MEGGETKMLEIIVEGQEYWDEEKEVFHTTKPVTLHMEHSLVSLSKWESKFKKSFLRTTEKTYEETIYYFKCMTITKNVKDEVYYRLSRENIEEINRYISDPMTSTYIPERKGPASHSDVQTAEVIYYQMLSNGIPMECQKWHLNRLITLIRVFNYKNDPKGGKMSREEALKKTQEINKQRREMYRAKNRKE